MNFQGFTVIAGEKFTDEQFGGRPGSPKRAIAATRNGRYEDSVALLVKAAALMKRMDRKVEFVQNLDALRGKYKIKRNFIKLVERNRKLLYVS